MHAAGLGHIASLGSKALNNGGGDGREVLCASTVAILLLNTDECAVSETELAVAARRGESQDAFIVSGLLPRARGVD